MTRTPPTIEDLVRHPERVTEVAGEAVAGLLAEVESLRVALSARLFNVQERGGSSQLATRLLTAPQVAKVVEVLLDRRQQLAHELAEVEDAIWRKKMASEGSSAPADEVLRIREACTRMRWSYSWAVKHWRELGGFKDVDGGLKIRAAVLARHEPGES